MTQLPPLDVQLFLINFLISAALNAATQIRQPQPQAGHGWLQLVPRMLYRQMRRLVGSDVANINHSRMLAITWNRHPHATSLAQLCYYEPSLQARLLEIPSMGDILALHDMSRDVVVGMEEDF